MKSLKEALVHKHMDRYQYSTKKDLKPGYVVRYRGQHLAMYMDKKTAYKVVGGRLGPGLFDMFVYLYGDMTMTMGLSCYDDNLRNLPYNDAFSMKFDVIEIYPIKTEPKLLTQGQLADLIKHTNPIEINQ